MTDLHCLYALSHSLYSGRARAYLIKQRIAFQERSTGHESFKAEVLPKAKLATIPTLVTPQERSFGTALRSLSILSRPMAAPANHRGLASKLSARCST